ncbi:MAG: ABC transporter substrate-binding protein [Microthrixaceae bacterium]
MSDESTTKTSPGGEGRDRLFRGYGPLVGFMAVFLAIAVLVPSQQREVRVEALDATELTRSGQGAEGGDLATEEGAEVAGATETADAAAADAAAAEAAAAAAAAGGGGGAGAAGGAGKGASTGPANVSGCADRQLQVPSDPYSPPCRTFSGGNGGGTSNGVSGDTIRVSVRIGSFSNGMLDALSKVAKAQIPDESPEVITRTLQGLVEYFNRTYQFYGRKLELVVYDGKGDVLKEATGGGQEGAEADALKVSQEIKAFADISAVSPIYADALARRGVVNIGAPFMSREWLSQRSPYVWSQFTDCSTIVESVGSYYVTKMANQNADLAGGELKGQPRKVGIIAPENSWYQECVAAGVRILQSGGVSPTLNERYRLEINQMSIQAGEKLAKLKAAGVTTVVCGCDPLFLTFLTAKAKEQNYNPEWLITGVALIDNDMIGSIMEPGQWSRSFGVSFSGPTQPAGRSLGYRAYKAVRKDEPSIGVDLIYNQLQLLAIGIQMAGPNLNPQSYQKGMFDYPTRTGPSGTWGFKPGDHSTSDDTREVIWNPRQTSIQTRNPGAYVDPNGGQRFPIGKWPAGPPRVAG